jgi:GNAT superfamily N-acetyltransferase
MPEVTIRSAFNSEDSDAVRQLCRDYVTWQIKMFPELRKEIEAYFEPQEWERTLADLPRIHARPKGDMLLALVDDEPLGCIMYHEMSPGIAEFKRLYVAEQARGMGLGKSLVVQAQERARRDGYRKIRLDGATFLAPAIKLYQQVGFRIVEPFFDVPPELADIVVYMERDL